MPSKWLDWTPDRDEIMPESSTREPSKPSEKGFDGFEGPPPGLFPIIQDHKDYAEPWADAIGKVGEAHPSKPSEPPTNAMPLACPAMPEGIRLVCWDPKPAPIALTKVEIVNDVPRFVSVTLLELKAALSGKRSLAGNRSVRDLIERLEECGVLVEVERGDASRTQPSGDER
jgi:hypothetical protein